MRVVLDTNVIVSGLNFRGNEEHVLNLARRGRFDLYLSPFILAEASSVLSRKFGWEDEATESALGRLRDAATLVEPTPGPPVVEGNACPCAAFWLLVTAGTCFPFANTKA